jgi:hypothetical protein
LQCPECGTKPIFAPWRQTRSLRDWFTPLDGCPRCGYAFEREPGYFLLAIWAVNYGLGSLLGLAIYFVLLFTVELTTRQILTAVLGPVLIFNLAFARHAKAIFLAFDHFCDPHRPPGDEGDGNRPNEKPPTNKTPGGGLPWPTEPARVAPSQPMKPERV